jgi:MFS family permease
VAPVYGTVADIRGRKPALLCAIVLLFAGSAICGWSNTVAQLITGRAVQGSGAGGIIVLVNISISDIVECPVGLAVNRGVSSGHQS